MEGEDETCPPTQTSAVDTVAIGPRDQPGGTMTNQTLQALITALRQAQADETPRPVVIFTAASRAEVSGLIHDLEAIRDRPRMPPEDL